MNTNGTIVKTVTKKDLVDRIADNSGEKRSAVKKIVQTFLDEIVAELANGNRLEFRDFGVFEIRERAARIAQNPRTMEKVPVPRKRTVKFKVGRMMKVHLIDQPARPKLVREAKADEADAAPIQAPAPDVKRPVAAYPQI